MARARSLKPGFFINDELAKVPALGRLLFAGLWCIADRKGRLEDRPSKIRAQTLPYDNVDCDELLNVLAAHDFIERYQRDGKAFIQIKKFEQHQNPHVKEAESTIPAPEKHGAKPGDSGTSRALTLNPEPYSLNPVTDSPLPEMPAGKPAAPTTPVFEAYSQAYASRHGVAPARNAETNAVLKRFGEKVGWPDAPAIAAFFVSSNDAFLVRERHPLKVLAANAEKYRTEWLTGCQITGNQARQQERTADNPFARMTKQTQRAIAHEN